MSRSIFHLLSFALLLAALQGLAWAQQGPRLAPPPPAPQATHATLSGVAAPAAGPTVDPSDRAASVQFYLDQYVMASEPAHGWDGSVASCTPGTTSAAFQAAVARRINYFRAMAGVPAGIVFDPSLNAKAQAAALMMSANNDLSHGPPPSWRCYSNLGAAGAGSSNLALGAFGWGAIDLYMEDPGEGNYFVGHRRWVLHPHTLLMGTGDVPPGDGRPASNALAVFGASTDPAPALREPEGFVAWPPRGYVPYTVVYPRWSFSFPDADFTAATVTMRRANGAPVALAQQPVQNGYGLNTIVWEPSAASMGFDGSRPGADLPFDVTISNVRIGGQPRSFSYRVTIIDVNLPPHSLTLSPLALAENEPAGAEAGILSAIDPEGERNISYALEPGPGSADNSRFRIDGNILRTAGPLDFEQQATYSVRVQADDGRAGGTASAAFTITIQDANDPPSGVVLQAADLAENEPPGAVAGQLTAIDQDRGDRHTFALVAGEGGADNALFEISGATLRTLAPLDFEAKARYSVRVAVYDQAGASTAQALTVAISDANDPPTIDALGPLFAPLDGPFRATLRASDQDRGDALTLSAADLPPWLSFQDNGDGTATIQGEPTSEHEGLVRFTFSARDRAGAETSRLITIEVGTTSNYLPLVISGPRAEPPPSPTAPPPTSTPPPDPGYQFQFGRNGFWVGLCEVVRPTHSATLSEFAADPFFYFASRYPAAEQGAELHFVVYGPSGGKVLDRAYGPRDDPTCFEGVIPMVPSSPAGTYTLIVDRDGRVVYQTTFALLAD